MPLRYTILEVLGWIGLAILLLTATTVIGTLIVSAFLNPEFGVPLLVIGILIILGATIAGYYLYQLFPLEQQIWFGIPKYVKCPYCGMNNSVIDVFCARCGKTLPGRG